MSRNEWISVDTLINLQQQALRRSIEGKRGQAFLLELIEALDAIPDKKLYNGKLVTTEGGCCALGALGIKRGLNLEALNDEENTAILSKVFNIAPSLVAEIMYLNDESLVDVWKWGEIEVCGPMRPKYPDWGRHYTKVRVHNDNHPTQRWQRMRDWAVSSLK